MHPVALSIDDHAKFTDTVAAYPGANTGSKSALTHCALGLTAEAGEVAGALEKCARKNWGDDKLEEQLFGELGDVLYWVQRICREKGWSLETVAAYNTWKLEGRHARGEITG